MLTGVAFVLAATCALAGVKQAVWKDVERIVAVGDVHGDYNQFEKVLRDAKVIDEGCEWIGEKTHLVQTGDLPDRGPDTRKAMDLLMKLEKQAPKAGGMVHALIGNHEVMNLTGDYRYVTPGEYEAFGSPEEYRNQMGHKGEYGKWIVSNNSVVKINDIVFVHGGISVKYADTPIEELNSRIRESLSQGRGGIGKDSAGPQWFRGLSRDSEEALDAQVNDLLAKLDASHIVVGHTVSPTGIQPRLGGRIIMIDVGMSAAYGGPAACLVVEDGNFFALTNGQLSKLPIEKAAAQKAQ